MSKACLLKKVAVIISVMILTFGLLSNDYKGKQNKMEVVNAQQSQSYDISDYAGKLKDIGKKQKDIDNKIKDAEKKINAENEKQEVIYEKIKLFDEKISVINAYMTELEIRINENKRAIKIKKDEIEKDINDFKKRLRVIYLSGNNGYAQALLGAKDFYDVLMRVDIIKNIAYHDKEIIDALIEKKKQLDLVQKDLDEQQAEYDKQYEELSLQREEQNTLYEGCEKAKDELKEEQEKLAKENEKYIEERKQYEDDLSDILKSTYGNSGDDTVRESVEILANLKLEKLHSEIAERKKSKEEIEDTECLYDFKWPVPDNYYVSSGVGERWGTYHTGIDIVGAHGTEVCATESGRVIKTNSSCPHDYGKSSSCGCGSGYGNYVIIDHGNDFISLYGHLSALHVEVGDEVKQGDVIGNIGSTGNSTGDHLHFEICYEGKYLNPAAFVSIG